MEFGSEAKLNFATEKRKDLLGKGLYVALVSNFEYKIVADFEANLKHIDLFRGLLIKPKFPKSLSLVCF
jgi:hypothetical protein